MSVERKPRPGAWSAEEAEAAVSLRSRGWTYEQIAEKLSRSRKSVAYCISKHMKDLMPVGRKAEWFKRENADAVVEAALKAAKGRDVPWL